MPDWKNIVRERIAHLNLEGAAESNLTEEFGDHLEDRYRELLSGGTSPDEAYRETLSELDDLYPLRGVGAPLRRAQDTPIAGEKDGGSWVHDLMRDLRYAMRTMRKSPLFVVFVVLTLALGIGANATVFTVINTLLLNPLPVPHASTLVAVGAIRDRARSQTSTMLPLSHADLMDYQVRNSVFTSLAGYTSPQVFTFQERGASERLFGELVTGNYFSTLTLAPARGRYFLPDEDSVPGAHPVAVLNYGTWQSRFGGDPQVIGREIRLNGLGLHVIGVAPPHFIGLNALFGPDLWIPAAMMEQLFPNQMQNALRDRNKTLFLGVGRLKPNVGSAQAEANLTAIANQLAHEFPAADEERSALMLPVRDVLFGSSQQATRGVMFATLGLLAIVAIVLLIACSNVANLLLARAASRQQEIAVRLAMGAGRSRLIRQLLTESLLLALLSGAVGLVVALGGLKLLFASLPSSANFITPKLDVTVFTFALFVSLATGLIFGLIPALKASRVGVAEALKEEARTVGKSAGKVNVAKLLLVGQVAFSFLLLVIAALFLRSIGRAYDMDPGFQTAHLDVFMTTPTQAGYDTARTRAYYKDVKERVRRLPGVAATAWSSNLPLWGRPVSAVEVEGRQKRSRGDQLSSMVITIDPDYFDAAGSRIDRGRPFNAGDRSESLPVAIVNEKFAHDFWPTGDAIGKRVQVPGETTQRVIVGVARNGSYTSWSEPPQLCVYVPLEQHYTDVMTLYVRTKSDPSAMMSPILGQLHTAGPQVHIDPRTGKQIIDGGLFQARLGVALLSVFGFLALGLASIGLYGILAYSVAQRKREIGLRMALGAGQGSVLRLILRQGMRLVLTGVVIGLLFSLVVGRMLSRMLYGIGGSDPLSVLGAAVVLLLVALAACYLPARWASRVDPLVALREG